MKPWIAAAALAAVARAGPVETEASAGTGTVDPPAYCHSYLMLRNATDEVTALLDRHGTIPTFGKMSPLTLGPMSQAGRRRPWNSSTWRRPPCR